MTPPTRIAAFKRGFGYAAEYRVYLRESFVGRVAPVSRELILCVIAERGLGLPRSY